VGSQLASVDNRTHRTGALARLRPGRFGLDSNCRRGTAHQAASNDQVSRGDCGKAERPW
jgi:hypothetical protein